MLKRLTRDKLFNWILYLSFIFLLVGLYQADYLKIPSIKSVSLLLLSFPVMFIGFWLYAYIWGKILRLNDEPTHWSSQIAACGLPVFAKYIPGKVWAIIGRAAYVDKYDGVNLGKASLLSMKAQVIAIWVGFFVGILGYMYASSLSIQSILSMLALFGATPVFFFQKPADYVNSFIKTKFNKDVEITMLDWPTVRTLFIPTCLKWLLWSAGFYLMAQALLEQPLDPASGLVFALATNIGIVAIFAPGGIGIREGLIVFYLNYLGVGFSDATTIAVFSRLWYLIGEGFLFVIGVIADRYYRYFILLKKKK